MFESLLDLIGLICFGSFWLGYVYIKNDARIKLAQLQAGAGPRTTSGSDVEALRAEIAELRRQLSELRETSTAYDLSFDTALHRLERQMESRALQRVNE